MRDPNESFDLASLQAEGVLPFNLYMGNKIAVGDFEVVPFPDCRPELLALVRDGERIGKGGFSSVFALDEKTVCKVTTCPMTQALYAKQIQEHSRVEGIPVVYQYEGALGFAVQGELIAKAYVVERCRKPASKAEHAKLVLLLDHLIGNSPEFLSAENQDPACHAKTFADAALFYPACAPALTWLAQFIQEVGNASGDFKLDNLMYTLTGKIAFVDVLQELFYDPKWEQTLAERQAEAALYAAQTSRSRMLTA